MQIVEIKPTIDKITKISKLQPFYSIASVFHNSDDKNTPVLEHELKRFPKGMHDDIADCLSNIIEIMIPVSKTVDRNYHKYLKARESGVKVMY